MRSEWGIETGLHSRRDVTFQEDHTRMSHKPQGRVMASRSVNNLVFGLLNHQGIHNMPMPAGSLMLIRPRRWPSFSDIKKAMQRELRGLDIAEAEA